MIGSSVDERIVEMQFENEEFERDVSTSLKTLDKLKNALSFSGIKDGFSELQNGIAGVSFAAFEEGLYKIQDGFGMVEMLGLQAMARVSNAIIDMGTKLGSAITIDPIKSGLQEYETQIGAIQTIMSNTEEAFKEVSEQEHLDAVNETLDTLNHYADKTIYNFTEMTRNIGTFTAAGVDLETSKIAIQGIANAAAASGATSEQASRGMYQLSQALASGAVRLQDWNSVVSAGFGGEIFQTALKRASQAMVVANEKVQALAASGMDADAIAQQTGISLKKVKNLMEKGYATSADAAIEKTGTFRESLKEEWLTTDVLTDALTAFTLNLDDMTAEEQEAARAMLVANGYTEEQIEDIFKLGKNATEAATKVKTFSQLIDTTKEALQSGWTQSWEYIIGDFGEAKSLWTGISDYLNDAINKSAEARNTILKQWHDAGGRDSIIEGLSKGFKGLVSYANGVKRELDGFIPKITSDQLIAFSNTIKDIGNRIRPTREELTSFREQVRHFIQPLEIIKDFVKSFIEPYQDTFINTLKNTGKILSEVIDRVGKFVDFLSGMLRVAHVPGKAAELITWSFAKLGNTFINVYDKFKEFLSALTGFKFDFFDPKNGNWAQAGEKLGAMIDSTRWKIVNLGKSIGDNLKKFNDWFKQLTGIDLGKVFSWDNFIDHVVKFREAIASLPETVSGLKKNVADKINGVLSVLGSLFGMDLHLPNWDEFKNIISGFGQTISGWKENFLTTTASIQSFCSGVLTFLQPLIDKFVAAKDAVVNFFKSFKKDKETEEGFSIMSALTKVGDTMATIFNNIKNTALIVYDFVKTKFEELKSKINLKEIFSGLMMTGGIIGMLNIGALAKRVKDLLKGENVLGFVDSLMDRFKKIGSAIEDGLETLKGILEPFGDTLAAFQNKLKADMLKNIAVAVAILVGSLVVVSLVDSNRLASSVAVIGALMYELSALLKSFTTMTDKYDPAMFGSITTSLIKAAAAVFIMASAAKMMGDMEPEETFRGVLALGGIMAELTVMAIVLSKLDKGDNVGKSTKGMITLAIAVRLLAGAVKSLGDLDWGQIARGLVGLAGIFIGMGLFTKIANLDKVGVLKGAGLILLAIGIKQLVGVVDYFKDLDLPQIGKGLLGLAGILLAVGLYSRIVDANKTGVLAGIGLILMAQAVKSLSKVVLEFAKLDLDQIGKGLLGVAGILLSLAIATRLMPKNMIAIGIGMMLMGSTLKIMTNALMTIGTGMDFDQIKNAVLAIASSMLILAAAAISMEGTIGGAASMMVMAIALNMLVPAFKALGSLGWDQIAKALAAIAGVFIVLGVAGTVLAPIVPFILALAGALMMISAASALAGIGLMATAAGLGAIARIGDILGGINLMIFLENLKTLGHMVLGLVSVIIDAVFMSISSLVDGLIMLAPKLFTLVKVGILGICDVINQTSPAIITTAINLLITLMRAIEAHIDDFTVLAFSIMIKFMYGIATFIGPLAQAGAEMMISFLEAMANAVVNNADRLAGAFENLFYSVLYTLLTLVQTVLDGLPVVGTKISTGIEGIKEDIVAQMNYNEGRQIAGGVMLGIKDGISEGANEVSQETEKVVGSYTDALTSYDAISQAVDVGKNLGDSSVVGMQNADSESAGQTVAGSFLNGLLSQNEEVTAAGTSIGTTLGGGFLSGLNSTEVDTSTLLDNVTGDLTSEDSTSDFSDAGTTLGESTLSGFDGVDTTESSNSFIDKLVNGVNSEENLNKVKGSGEAASEAGVSGFGGSFGAWEESGKNLMQGAANGITNNTNLVEDAAYNAGIAAHNSFNNASGVESPSWKYAESGKYSMMGGALGIKNNMKLLVRAAETAGDETVGAFSESMSDLDKYTNFSDDLHIRPVVDLKDIDLGKRSIKSLFSNDLPTRLTFETRAKTDVGAAVNELGDLTMRDNKEILTELRKNTEATNMLINLLRNQRMYLDSGKLIGAVVSGCDAELGTRALLAGRRG